MTASLRRCLKKKNLDVVFIHESHETTTTSEAVVGTESESWTLYSDDRHFSGSERLKVILTYVQRTRTSLEAHALARPTYLT